MPKQDTTNVPRKQNAPRKPAVSEAARLAEMKRKNKKRAKITLIVLLAATVVLTVLYFLPYDRILSAMFPAETSEEEEIFFYPSDFGTDILKDREYTALSRHLQLTLDGRETVFIFDDADSEKYGPAPAVLWRYLQTLIRGDADGYNSLFTEEYLEENGKQAPYPMQRIYNISAVCYSKHTFTKEELDGKYEGITQYRYRLDYSIQYNDGSVRNDMGSGVTKPIYLEILVNREETSAKINSISHVGGA